MGKRLPAGLAGLFAVFLLGTTAWGQVATTPLNPAAVRFLAPEGPGLANNATITPDNPAALLWAPGSLVAAGIVDVEEEATDLDASPPRTFAFDFQGRLAGLRLVGGRVAAAAEQLEVRDDSGTPFGEATNTNGQLAFHVSDALAFGAGLSRYDLEYDVGAGEENTERMLGFSLRLGWFFLGYASGKEELKRETPGGPATFDRGVQHYGAAVRTLRDGWQWYLEHAVIDRENFDFRPFRAPEGGFTTRSTAMQLIAWNVLLGGGSIDVHVKGPNPPERIDISWADVGWVPVSGFTLSARRTWFALDDPELTPGEPDEFRIVTDSVALAWQF